MRRSVLCAALLMFAMSAIGGCASSPQYFYNVDSAANLANYRTFGFFDEREPGMAAYQSVAHRHLKSAIVRELLARGYRRSEQPELLVNIHVQRRDQAPAAREGGGSDYYTYRGDHYAWRAGVPTVASDYSDGTLNIDVIDPASRALLWEGIAVGSVSQRMYESLEATIDSVVAKLFERFPKQSPSQAST
ncbi:MAG TPA: DUF4136 domain-containing protein [Steroidobacter sp.]|uniref:DUF4136 domain-containing protein n=1 Tax=Steroidobacter sp. TaxID=1978227 RepID=UPI002EDA32C4